MVTKLHKKLFLGLAVLFALVVASEAIKYLAQSDAVDLCNKIIGSRLLGKNISPYSYFWQQGDPQSLYNPYETIRGKVNSLTAPPSLLIIMKPLSLVGFTQAKWIWLLLSYLMLAGSIFLFSELAKNEDKIIIWTFSVFFFLTSTGWLLHAERGQVYVVYLFLLSCTYFFYRKEYLFLSIGFLAVLIWLRFPFVIFALPFISYLKNYKLWLACFFYVIVLVGITLIASTPSDWIAYWDAVHEWSKAQITQTELFADAHSQKWRTYLVGKEDGRDYLINNSSIQYLAQYHFKIRLFPVALWSCFLAGLAVLFCSLRRYFYDTKKEFLFLLSFLAYILFELCIPAPRYNYNYIQWLFPFLLLMTGKEKISIGIEYYFFFLLGLLLNMGIFFFIPRAITLGEGILYMTLWCWLCFGNKKTTTIIPLESNP